MIVNLFITLLPIIALPAFGWHPPEATEADIPDKLVQPAALYSSGLPLPGFLTLEIQPGISNCPGHGDLNEVYAPLSSPAGFVPV
jgi:hypothetical protein